MLGCSFVSETPLYSRFAAEAAGLRSTGIGCFFDNPTVRIACGAPVATDGDASNDPRPPLLPPLFDLYHHAVGKPVDDERLQTLDPYASS